MFDFLDKMKYELKSLFERIITNTRRFFCKHYYVVQPGAFSFTISRLVKCQKCGLLKEREPYMTIHEK